eukprot:jgi/Chlat1/7436/Chrsp6S07491
MHACVIHFVLQAGGLPERQLSIIDRNRDLYLAAVLGGGGGGGVVACKLAAVVSSALWNSSCNALAAIADQQLVVWYYPAALYIDRELLPLTRSTRDAR